MVLFDLINVTKSKPGNIIMRYIMILHQPLVEQGSKIHKKP